MCNVTYHSLLSDSAKDKKILVGLIYTNVLCARLTTATTNTTAASLLTILATAVVVVVVVVIVVVVVVMCVCVHS